MTISIQLQSTDDLKVLEPLLQMLEQFEVDIQIMPGPSKKRKAAKSLKSLRGVSERLHGIVQLPEGFDYKSELGDALLKKYTSHG